MQNTQNVTYEVKPYGVDVFHEFLMSHPALSHFSYEEWNIVFRALRKAEKIHAKKFRDNDKRPYMIHIVEMIVEYLTRYSAHRIRSQDISALALHDVVEEVPECWRDILNEF